MNTFYKTIGISKQAVMQYDKRQEAFDKKLSDLIVEADELRKSHPGCGVEKMYNTLKPDFIGRDRFIETFMALGYRLKRKRNYCITTRSGSFYYPNLIEGMEVNGPNQIWQSDITYIRVGESFYYAVFIIDVYSKKIVGYNVTDHMRATANVRALRNALREHGPPKVHHSDRGSQYIYKEYVSLLREQNCKISMGEKAQENAYAERINGTIKNEFINYWKPKSLQQLKKMVTQAVNYYNLKRPHNHIDKLSPDEYLQSIERNNRSQKRTITIFKPLKQKTVNSI
jgi:hypothetical protein